MSFLVSQSRAYITRFVILLVSTILSLVILEAGLRLTGKFIVKKKMNRSKTFNASVDLSGLDNKQIRVLTLGDSITFGGWGTAESSYPAILQDNLDAIKNNKYFVTNNGMCGNTTHSILQGLKSYLKIHQPHYLFLMIGAANRYRFEDYLFDIEGVEEKFVNSLRVFKMIKFIFNELEQKYFIKRYTDTKYANVEAMWIDYSNKSVTHLRNAIEKIRSNPNYLSDIRSLIQLGHINEHLGNLIESDKYLSLAFKLEPRSNDVRTNYAFFKAGEAGRRARNHQYDDAMKLMLEAVDIAPNNSYIANIFKPLTIMFKNQSVTTFKQVVSVMDKKLKREPQFKFNKIFMSNYRYYKNIKAFDKKIKDWIASDLYKIAKTCKENQVQLVLMNYPVPYHLANDVLESSSREYSLPFIDITAVFKKLIGEKKELYSKYIKDDDHCTKDGHEIIAREVARFLSTGYRR